MSLTRPKDFRSIPSTTGLSELPSINAGDFQFKFQTAEKGTHPPSRGTDAPDL
jgi:hypothetical protein